MKNLRTPAIFAIAAVAGLLVACNSAYCESNKNKDKGTSGTDTTQTTDPGNSGNNNNNNPKKQDPITPVFQQDNFNQEYGVNTIFNGTPNTVSGQEHDLNGNPLYYTQDPAILGPENTSTTTTPTSWPVITVPALAIPPAVQTNPGVVKDLNGGDYTPNEKAGILIDGVHNENTQLVGGLSNNASSTKWFDIEGLIGSVKASADYYFDLSKDSFNVQSDKNNYKLVYVKVPPGSELHLSGSSEYYGVLVVELEDPDNSSFVMSGQAKWVGLIIVVADKRQSANSSSTLLDIRGGGNDVHILGGAILYSRNKARSNGTGIIYGSNFYRTRGTSDAWFSSAALRNALARVTAPYQARAWRRLE